MTDQHVIGVISDTHGLLRPEAMALLAESDLIIHAGDIGSPTIIEDLSAICPTQAVRGNVDTAPWASAWRDSLSFDYAGRHFHILHDLKELDHCPAPPATDIVISGHSHKPSITTVDGVLYLNPGSAGRRRFSLPVSMARLVITASGMTAEILDLTIPA